MNAIDVNDATMRRRRVLRWTAITAALAVVVATGLLTVRSFSRTSPQPQAAINAYVKVAPAPRPVTAEIVPSAVIDAHRPSFLGTGDGNVGFHPDQPNR